MKIKKRLLTATSLAAGVLCAQGVLQQAFAQDASDTIETIVVTGIKGSMSKSAEVKRDSKQIVDVITAEDVGKLPDNNVPEALAHVTGVQIERIHGEGTNVSIRGMSSIVNTSTTLVQTTLNGNTSSVGESRSMNLSDIPAELLKAVTVYKSRSADQVEGGIAGSVNVDLRRPLDLPDGPTVAGSIRAVNASIGDTWSPYASLLLADRFQTGIGEMGVLLNVSYTQNNYFENYFYNESPDYVSWHYNTLDPDHTLNSQNNTYYNLSAANRALNNGYGPIAPYATYYGFEQGSTTRPSINLSTQWRANDNLDFVLEGAYISSKNKNNYNKLKLVSRTDSFILSNISLLPNTGSMAIAKSYSFSNGTGIVNGGPESIYIVTNSDEFNTNFETHWHSGRWQINGSVQYNWSGFKENDYQTIFRFNNSTSGSVDFNSAAVGGGPLISYDNVDLSDASNYDIYNYHDLKTKAKSQELDSQVDLTYHVSDAWYLRDIQMGSRYTNRHTTRNYGYRDANFFTDTTAHNRFLPVSSFTCGDRLQKISPDLKGSPSWYRVSPQCLLQNLSTLHNFIKTSVAAKTATSSSSWWKAADWDSIDPPDADLTQSYEAHEYSLAGYAKASYAFNALVPVDGEVGVRIVNTWGDAFSIQEKWLATSPPPEDTVSGGTKNYTDVLPSASAIVHFTDKLQMRLSYFYQIDRPDFMASTAWETIDTNCGCIWAGNPNLKPMREHNYDATVEYFFGKGGQVSAGYFLKKPHGWLFYEQDDGANPYASVASSPYKNYHYNTTFNANPGTFEGLEFNAQSFFDFLPGIWANFGASANATLMTAFKIQYPYSNYTDEELATVNDIYAAQGTSRYTYNVALYYDTPMFSARLAYNFRSAWRTGIYANQPQLSTWNDPTSRLDAAVNYTPYNWVTFSVEGSNLLEEANHSYWGKQRYLPESTRMAARTVQLSARFRY